MQISGVGAGLIGGGMLGGIGGSLNGLGATGNGLSVGNGLTAATSNVNGALSADLRSFSESFSELTSVDILILLMLMAAAAKSREDDQSSGAAMGFLAGLALGSHLGQSMGQGVIAGANISPENFAVDGMLGAALDVQA